MTPREQHVLKSARAEFDLVVEDIHESYSTCFDDMHREMHLLAHQLGDALNLAVDLAGYDERKLERIAALLAIHRAQRMPCMGNA